jgi:hypothetical protein
MFRKLLAGATAVVATAAISIIGLASPAMAGGSTDPVPYTVTSSSLTLPTGHTFNSSSPTNDGNVKFIPVSQYRAGQTYTHPGSNWNVQNINFHIEQNPNTGKAMIGSSTLPFDSTTSDGAFRGVLPSSGYCIVWVQVDGFNEHFGEGGQAPVCSGTADASADLSVTPATCTAAQTLVLGATKQATWGTPDRTTGPGDYSVTATAVGGHLFSNGSAYQTFTGHLDGTSTDGCGPETLPIRSAPSYTPATCTAAGSLVVPSQDHIVWSGGSDGAGPGHYVVVASIAPADAGTYTLGAQQTSWSIDVRTAGVNQDGSAMSCTTTVCLPNSAVSYTYSASTNSGRITVANLDPSKYSDALCNGFYVTATGWKYTSTGLWPQSLDGFTKANSGHEIAAVGVYDYGYPITCGQGDIYAAFSPVPDPYGPLNGPSNTYPEHFLHDMGFHGPNPTYTQTSHGNCNVLDKNYVVPTASAITGCGISGSITYPTDADTATKVGYQLSSGNGTTGVNVVRATAISPWIFPDGSTTKDFTFDLGSYTDCVKPAVTDEVGACTAHGADPSSKTVTFTFDNTKSTVPVTFAIANEHISVVVGGGDTGHATATVPEAGASYAVTVDSGAGPAVLDTLVVPSFVGCRTSVAGDPSATPASCVAGVQGLGSITVDLKQGIVYTITDAKGVGTVVTQATTPEPAGDYVVTAAPDTNYSLTLQNPSSWPYKITVGAPTHCGETPKPATASTAVSCSIDGTYTLPVDTNVRWQVVRGVNTQSDVAPGTYRAFAQFFDATVVVTALPTSGVQFAPGATTSWTFHYAAPPDCLTTFAQLPVTWTHTDAVCTSGSPLGTITAGTADEVGYVAYTVDGSPVTAGATVRVAAGDHILVGTAVQTGDTVDPAGPQTVTVKAAPTICPTDLKTLALTGDDPLPWLIGGLAILQLGVALVAVHLLRRRRHGRHAA